MGYTSQAGVGLWYTACTTATIANVKYPSSSNPAQAYTCDSDYAVATASTSCVSFTTDSNCRQLGTGDAYCSQCWYSYYFNAVVCTLSAGSLVFGGLVAVALAMF